MAGTYSDMFLRAKLLIRAHPELTDDEVAEQLGVRAFDGRGMDTIRTARREIKLAGGEPRTP